MFVFQRKLNDKDALVIQSNGTMPIADADVVVVYVDDEGNFTYASGKMDEQGEFTPDASQGGLPEVTLSDDGKVLTVIEGAWGVADSQGTEVVANPTLVGTEADLTGLQVGDTKYKVPSGGSSLPTSVHTSADLFLQSDGTFASSYTVYASDLEALFGSVSQGFSALFYVVPKTQYDTTAIEIHYDIEE